MESLKESIFKILFCFSFIILPVFGKFYLGIESGFHGGKTTFEKSTNQNGTKNVERINLYENGLIANFTLGTEHFFFDDYFGLRWSGFVGFGSSWGKLAGKTTQLDLLSLGANFDLIGNFLVRDSYSVGIVAGIEYGFIGLNPKEEIKTGEIFVFENEVRNHIISNKTFIDGFVGRVGITANLYKHHRLDLLFKIPFNEVVQPINIQVNNNGNQSSTRYEHRYGYWEMLLGYKYVF